MNAGAKANHDKALQIASKIATWRSEGLTYKDIGRLLGISSSAAKQRLWRYRRYQERLESHDTQG